MLKFLLWLILLVLCWPLALLALLLYPVVWLLLLPFRLRRDHGRRGLQAAQRDPAPSGAAAAGAVVREDQVMSR